MGKNYLKVRLMSLLLRHSGTFPSLPREGGALVTKEDYCLCKIV